MLISTRSAGNGVVAIPDKDRSICRADNHSVPSQNRTDTPSCTADDHRRQSLKTIANRACCTIIRKIYQTGWHKA